LIAELLDGASEPLGDLALPVQFMLRCGGGKRVFELLPAELELLLGCGEALVELATAKLKLPVTDEGAGEDRESPYTLEESGAGIVLEFSSVVVKFDPSTRVADLAQLGWGEGRIE